MYISMTDKSMSYWGMSKGKINKLIIKCNTKEEAMAIAAYVSCKNEFKDINVLEDKPKYNDRTHYVSDKDIIDAQYWLSEGRKILKESIEE